MNPPVYMNEDDWFDQFEPLVNPFDTQGSWRGCLYGTVGPSYALVQAALARGDDRIWTLLDCDGKLMIGNGWHWVNRMGYFITAHPAQPETDYEITDPECDPDDDNDEESEQNDE